MLDLKKDEFEGLNPTQAEELIERLCIAEVEERGGDRSMVGSGSHTDAHDQRVDTQVKAPRPGYVGSYILKPWTRIQVKSGKNKSKIKRALLTGRGLHPRVQEIVSGGGGFIVVSTEIDMSAMDIEDILTGTSIYSAIQGKFPRNREIFRFWAGFGARRPESWP